MQVKYLEVVDAMVGQLLRRLSDAETASSSSSTAATQPSPGGGAPAKERSACSGPCEGFVVCVTGDHSTPVIFGDHSHEPVPVAVAHVADAVCCSYRRTVLNRLWMSSISFPSFCCLVCNARLKMQQLVLESCTWFEKSLRIP